MLRECEETRQHCGEGSDNADFGGETLGTKTKTKMKKHMDDEDKETVKGTKEVNTAIKIMEVEMGSVASICGIIGWYRVRERKEREVEERAAR